jgi:small nuclear ribonucleoprotein (snRNP)-like protein
MYKRPISIEHNKLYLRYGIMSESIIDINNIISIELSSSDVEIDNDTRNFSFLGNLASHNVVIKLHKEETLIGFYGVKKTYKILLLHVDEKLDFKRRLESFKDNNDSTIS